MVVIIMKLTIQNKLFMGFGAVLVVIALVSINNFAKMNNVSDAEHSLIELGLPTVIAGMQLTDGIHLSLAGLRGYMILGEDPKAAVKFKAERLSGWKQIDQAIQKMDGYSEHWVDRNNVVMLNKIKLLTEESPNRRVPYRPGGSGSYLSYA